MTPREVMREAQILIIGPRVRAAQLMPDQPLRARRGARTIETNEPPWTELQNAGFAHNRQMPKLDLLVVAMGRAPPTATVTAWSFGRALHRDPVSTIGARFDSDDCNVRQLKNHRDRDTDHPLYMTHPEIRAREQWTTYAPLA